MRITVEIRERTQVYVHDIKPALAQLTSTPQSALYVLRDANFINDNNALALFMELPQLQSLYEQIKELLEPETTNNEIADLVGTA